MNQDSPIASLEFKNPEVVFGIVAPVGSDLTQLRETIRQHLKRFGYELNHVRLSEFLGVPRIRAAHNVTVVTKSEFDRIRTLMDAGNSLRSVTGKRDFLGLLAASHIGQLRAGSQQQATVHLLDSLKTPEEVATLRRIYGSGFFLIGVYTSDNERRDHLLTRGVSAHLADRLIERDRDDPDEYGQRTRETFHLADVFLRFDGRDINAFQADTRRFIDLVFGHPFFTPTRDENAMFLAYAAALRSADLSRQVGAVVVSATGEVIATGANDVPRFGGGLYWPGPGDQRDHVWGKDSNKVEIEKIAASIAEKIAPRRRSRGRLSRAKIEKILLESPIQDLTEFGRPVHAEMEAIACCARVGVSPKDGVMYTTTFPCHNCAKHIVAAGIREVQYVEPYPKSKALDLHKDSLSVDNRLPDKVAFVPFVGVSARRYFDLFSLKLSTGRELKRKDGAKRREFNRSIAQPRVTLSPVSYIDRELVATTEISDTLTKGIRNGKAKSTNAKSSR